MFARVNSAAISGVEAYKIDVEVDCCGGIGQFHIVGLPDASVKESHDRVRSAIKACALILPPAKKWVINLAPADTRKEGPSFDLPIAIAVLASCGLVSYRNLSSLLIVGELGLDGSVRPVSGVLPIAIKARECGIRAIIVPDANAREASLVDELQVFPVSHLRQAQLIVDDLRNGAPVDRSCDERMRRMLESDFCDLDFADVKGQKHARRAIEIAAAGRHNLLMVGPPGSGKSMLAERMPGIMPPLSSDEAIELTKLYSVAGLLGNESGLVRTRPFRAPHHSSTTVGLIGGGKRPRPGEISLSHQGILFLDELTEFSRVLLDNLRQPLESGQVTISRAYQSVTYPASFLLVGACNPCPCGYRGDPVKYCVCTVAQADRYWSRLSGPLLDRIDLHVEVARLNENELAGDLRCEASRVMRKRVLRAVEKQWQRNTAIAKEQRRFSAGVAMMAPNTRSSCMTVVDEVVENAIECNSSANYGAANWYNGTINHSVLTIAASITRQSREFLAGAISRLGLSARAYDRVIRIARTIADLDDSDDITNNHLAEALRYRILGRVI